MSLPQSVKIVEVSPRDGLQNEAKLVPAPIKIAFINALSETGLSAIEATSFVSAKWIPQFIDSEEVYRDINKPKNVRYSVLTPNLRGLERALQVGAQEIAVFTTPSESFSKKNTNRSVVETMMEIGHIVQEARAANIPVRAYLSCVLGCPYEGYMAPEKVAVMAEQLLSLGCYEVSLGDTIGVGTPGSTQVLLAATLQKIPSKQLAVHFHDTYGQALANIYVALEHGIAVIDSAVAGLGGCPYAKGASGNVATEDVVYMLQGLNIQTGIDLEALIAAGRWIADYLGRVPQSKVSIALTSIKNFQERST